MNAWKTCSTSSLDDAAEPEEPMDAEDGVWVDRSLTRPCDEEKVKINLRIEEFPMSLDA